MSTVEFMMSERLFLPSTPRGVEETFPETQTLSGGWSVVDPPMLGAAWVRGGKLAGHLQWESICYNVPPPV
eukprot:8334657-Pyramimonas_sp.AAC.1